jgi:hypothetical protein
MRIGKKGLTLAFAAVVILSGCGAGKAVEHAGHQHQLANGDLQETTASSGKLPDFLSGKPDVVTAAYRTAAENTDLLDYIPCYCGCGTSAGHRSNKNCFIAEVKADGSVVWDDHGTRCGVCMEIVLRSAQMKSEGKSVKEIRAAIDTAYGTGYAAATKTPMPM